MEASSEVPGSDDSEGDLARAAPGGREREHEILPTVEPPSGAFIVRLFVIPAVIVLVIALVVAWVSSLVNATTDPNSYIAALERNNAARWQVANSLADELRNPQNEELRKDAGLVSKLSDLLTSESARSSPEEDSLKLRVYLLHCLSVFRVDQALGPMIREAGAQRFDGEIVVRVAALRDIAIFLNNKTEVDLGSRTELMPTLLAAARDADAAVRSPAIFALSAIEPGTREAEQAYKQVERSLDDTDPNVRFNAATMLARRGNAACLDVLVEMLDPNQTAALDSEPMEFPGDSARKLSDEAQERILEEKRVMVLSNALKAAQKLAERNTDSDLGRLQVALAKLVEAELPIRSSRFADEAKHAAQKILDEQLAHRAN